MKRLPCTKTVLLWSICLSLAACSNHTAEKSLTGKAVPESAPADSLTMQKDDLAKIYVQAIAEFIKAANKKDKITFDTLFFGKHVYGQADDFPDITLPETIEQTPIRLITPELGLKKQQERKSLVYINLIGWVEKETAEFLLVVFSNGAAHQYDYTIDFNFNPTQKEFELDKIFFENFLTERPEKPGRVIIYQDGKYHVGN